MSQGNFGVRKRSAKPGAFETADLTLTRAREFAARLSALSKTTAYVVVDVDTDDIYATFMNGKDIG